MELMAEGRRVRAGWFARREFVCRSCKMATKRAVRQYGLLGSLETDGIVLPFGESEVSDRPRSWWRRRDGGVLALDVLSICFLAWCFLGVMVGPVRVGSRREVGYR